MTTKTKLSLSEIWTRASKELVQVTGSYGAASAKRACALGAIEYYRTEGANCIPRTSEWLRESYRTAVNTFVRALPRALIEELNGLQGLSPIDIQGADVDAVIARLNDYSKWTFVQFAAKAKELGL